MRKRSFNYALYVLGVLSIYIYSKKLYTNRQDLLNSFGSRKSFVLFDTQPGQEVLKPLKQIACFSTKMVLYNANKYYKKSKCFRWIWIMSYFFLFFGSC